MHSFRGHEETLQAYFIITCITSGTLLGTCLYIVLRTLSGKVLRIVLGTVLVTVLDSGPDTISDTVLQIPTMSSYNFWYNPDLTIGTLFRYSSRNNLGTDLGLVLGTFSREFLDTISRYSSMSGCVYKFRLLF